MATVKRRGIFRQHEPYATRDLRWYMNWKIEGYIDYLDSIDPDSIYTLEYDTNIPTKKELLNSIDQNHVQLYNPATRVVDKKDEDEEWFYTGELISNEEEDEDEEKKDIEEAPKLGSLIEQLTFNAKLNEERKQKLRAKRKQEEKEAEEKRLEREKIRLEQEREAQIQKQTREYVDNYYKQYKIEGLMTLYKQALDKIAELKFEKLQTDIIDEITTRALEAWEYRYEYIVKLIKIEQNLKNFIENERTYK